MCRLIHWRRRWKYKGSKRQACTPRADKETRAEVRGKGDAKGGGKGAKNGKEVKGKIGKHQNIKGGKQFLRKDAARYSYFGTR